MSRLDHLPPYLFTEIDRAKRAALAAGRDVVDLGIGDPDCPTPAVLVERMVEAVARPANHNYPANQGSAAFRASAAAYMERRHGVKLDPDTQILALIGSKEGIAHLPLAFLEEGDETLVPDIGYPVYTSSTLLAGGCVRTYPLTAAQGFVPDPADLAGRIRERTRILMLNYPHNPTGATAGARLYTDLLVAGSRDYLVVANDAAYLEVDVGAGRSPSILAGADLERHRVVEFHSLSKMFNMTGWRIGFAAGSSAVIAALGRVKQNIDSGVFGAVQEVATYALGPEGDALLPGVMSVYAPRRALIVAALESAGFELFQGGATFYLWVRTPAGEDALAFCRRALAEQALVLTPGPGFGPGGEGWFRISLTAPDERIAAAAERLGRL
jgi:LL-diaminopimelate aminotransferase